MKRKIIVVLVGLIAHGVVGSSTASAQYRPSRQGPPPEWRFGFQSIGVGAPTGWHVGFGVAQEASFQYLDGHFLVAEVGVSGTRVSYGYGSAGEGLFGHVRLSAIRTYGDPWRAAANRTFLGAELRPSVAALTFGVGAYVQQGAVPVGDRYLVAFTLSLGL